MHDNTTEIIPGVIEKDWSQIEEKLEKIKRFAKSAHIDMIDGKFADNLTFLDPKPFKKYEKDIYLEAHLMVEKPLKYLKELSNSGFKRFIGHIEKMENIEEFVAQGQILGEVGIALDGPTSIDKLEKINLDNLDCILIYTSERVGHAGPPIKDERLEKIKELRQKTSIPIEADGGIKENTIEKARKAGANRFVATSFIWNSKDPKISFKTLQEKLSG